MGRGNAAVTDRKWRVSGKAPQVICEETGSEDGHAIGLFADPEHARVAVEAVNLLMERQEVTT